MDIKQYLKEINQRYKSGISTEHSYRPDLRNLIESMFPGVMATNEPQRIACGAPDYIITRKGIPVGFIEAKDIGADLNNKTYKEQFDRYKASLNNLIITDYLTFQFFVDGVLSTTLAIGQIQNGRIIALPDHFDRFNRRLTEFCSYSGQTITSAQKLAKLMAAKARLLADVIEKALSGEQSAGNLFEEANNTLREQMEAFRKVLIHDIDNKSFADMYAQTIAYGMFAARLNDPTLDTFTRQEAAELVPKSNPFLRRLFQYIAGYDLDDRIKWIVDALADLFKATNVAELMRDFGGKEHKQDPIIHFYETFLSEYDPSLRKSRGVWYTPHAVVNFIVRAVDDILKDEFGLPDGLADTSKVKIKVNELGKKIEKEVHRVQVLDPATGTGTFLAEIISQVHQKFAGQQGLWSNYVEEHLIPRLNGFEILMASYAMAHLKLELLLKETGYNPSKEQRLRVYLTNSLEEYHPDTGTLFASWLSHEANEANMIKRDTPVMVVLGNPPYSGESANKGKWIMNLMEDYKKEPGGIEKLKEKNPKWINDDYVKFLRYGQHFIERNGTGILAFINNHSFLDNPTFRGMRWNLLKTYDKIFIFDLHGNTKKKEVCPDGSKDENVFDIQQGVSVNLFIKTGRRNQKELGKVYQADLWGLRESKYQLLDSHDIKSIQYIELPNIKPNYFFVDKDFKSQEEYESGFLVANLFPVNSVGVVTANDKILVNDSKEDLSNNFGIYYNREANNNLIRKLSYRPFDVRFIYYDTSIVERARENVMQHIEKESNIGLIISKRNRQVSLGYVFISKLITDFHILDNAQDSTSLFPLYLCFRKGNQQIEDSTSQIPNLNLTIVNQIAESLQLTFTPEKETIEGTFAPIDILDYIYAVLHSPTYREKYKEFLKIDFPRVPYPKGAETFWQLVKLGGELRRLHLMESPNLNNLITQYPVGGDNRVEKITYEDGIVHINPEQYFANVPEVAWQFYIGGYQPAQKWLKDRKGRTLLFDDILHYQKIIVALTETDRLMKEIDNLGIDW